MKTLRNLMVPSLVAASLALGAVLVPSSAADAGVRIVVKPRPAKVVVAAPAPRPAAKVVIATPAPRAEKVWVAGHWKRVSPRRSVWVPGHWRVVK